jgi:hypothetical protein
MKIKKLILSVVTLSVFLISCSKEEINGVNIQPKESIEQPIPQLTIESTTESTQNARTSTETNFKAYVFIERQSRLSNIVNHLRSLPRNTQSTGSPFYGFFAGMGVFNSNYRDLNNYYNMVLWNNGVLTPVISVDVPQTTVGVDEYGNKKTAYNFSTIKITKGTLNEWAWVTILIPTSAMNNDTKKQTKIGIYKKNGNKITSVGQNGFETTINVNPMLSSYIIHSNGTVIPQGNYRVYSSYGGTSMRFKLNTTEDVYIRGVSN